MRTARAFRRIFRAATGSNGVPVLFNVDGGAGCRLQLNQSAFDELCATSGTPAFLNLPANLAIGRWGDATTASVADWLTVAAPLAASAAVLTASACQSMVTALDINIVYTASGLKSNPASRSSPPPPRTCRKTSYDPSTPPPPPPSPSLFSTVSSPTKPPLLLNHSTPHPPASYRPFP